MTVTIERYRIDIGEDVLADLRDRIQRTRWPDPAPGPPWSQGTDLEYLRGLLAYWADGFDWPAQQRWLNEFEHFLADIDGLKIHFVYRRAKAPGGVPLIATHGWPSTFLEPLSLVPLLTDPAAHGLPGPACDIVVPSLPGYAFSQRPAVSTYRSTAALWHRLMRALGYEHYVAQGGDFGAGVATAMALTEPDRMLAIHLNNLEIAPYTGPDAPPLTDAEAAYLAANQRWADVERGYSAIQSTKPQTVGYGLNDSPAGLAAWILEKWRSWTDSGGDLDARFGRDALLGMLTIVWATGSITSSMRDYYDNRWHPLGLGPDDRVSVPTGVAVFHREFVDEGEPPPEWALRLYNLKGWTVMPRGGHFAPAEEPALLAADIGAFLADLGTRVVFDGPGPR